MCCFKVDYDEVWENFGPVVADSWCADGFREVQILDSTASMDPCLVTSAVIIPVAERTWGVHHDIDELSSFFVSYFLRLVV